MKYSAGLVSKSFWYLESKKTANCMLDGLNREQIRDLAIKDNIYQVESEYRAKRMSNAIYSRLNSLPEVILEDLVKSDIATSKILVLISIMKTDRLFFEFMHEVFRNNIILGNFSLNDRDINVFFEEKKAQSDIVAKWIDSTIRRMKSEYIRMLNESGLLKLDSDKREIIIPFLDYRVKQHLRDNDMGPYVYAITGEK